MQEENRNDLTTAPETREVVDWYVPHRTAQQSPREVVDCYVHTDALPGAARPAAEKPSARQKGIGLWIFLGCMAALAVVVAVGILLNAQSSPVYTPRGSDAIDPNEGNPSSITHMYSDSDTAIPRYDPEGTAAPMRITAEAGEPLSAQAVYAKAAPSTVVVVAGTDKGAYVGTGVIMSEDGYVITNAHVIAEGQECFVATYMGYLYDALLVGADKERDVAVLKMLDAHDLPAAEFGNSENCLVGDTVYAIGNPLGLELMGTMTDGILSAINRTIRSDGRKVTVLQTTAALNNGNSGGPLINESGQVVGINTLKMSNKTLSRDQATVEGLGFALPINEVSYVVNSILATGRYEGKPTFGISVVTYRESDGTDRLEVYEVVPGSGADKAGMQEGDVILSVDGQEVHDTDALMNLRLTFHAGQTVTVRLRRGSQTMDVDVTLTAGE